MIRESFAKRPWMLSLAIVLSLAVLIPALNASADTTNAVYLKNCAICHGKDGKAQTSIAGKLGVKDLSHSKLSDAQIEQQIREGRPADQNSSKMPAFKDRLTDEEIKSLITAVKEFRTPPKPEAQAIQ